MKNYLLGMATVIIFGPVFRSVVHVTHKKLIEENEKSKQKSEVDF